MTFAQDTAVEPVGDARFATEIRAGWDIGGNANGGYLLALTARAMARHSGRPDPVSISAHYLSPGRPGAAAVHCTTVKEGRRFATVTASLDSGGKRLLQVLGAFGDLEASAEGPERIGAAPPELPPVDDCISSASDEGFAPPFMGRVDLRLHPEDAGFRVGQPSGEARMRGWFRLPGVDAVDTIGLLLGLDAFPPTIFNARLPVGWTPTVELTCHVRARPVPGWLRARFTTRFVTGGFLEEDGELWDAADRLVAQSRQLALVPRPQ
ncbi:MAG: thioesterase family protein [Pseudomonadales bacterium]|jgi:acyl-coenzyme A thioesterase PaaI-like protein|nr:thioesterase family protein [Pseudomonadales bacterium]